MAALDAAHDGAHSGPVFVDDAGRRARIVRLAGIAGALGLVAFIAMVAASLLGASWVPKLSLRVPGPAPTRVAAGPLLTVPAVPGVAASVPVPPRTTTAPAAASRKATPLLVLGAPATSPPTTAVARISPSTTAPGHSTAASPGTRGLSHKKASAGTTTTTSIP